METGYIGGSATDHSIHVSIRKGRVYRTMRTFLLLLTAALLCLLSWSCTAIGVGIGAAVDHHRVRPRHVTSEYAHTIPAGSDVRVNLISDSTLHGRFTGWRTLDGGKEFAVQSAERTTAVPLENIRDIFAMPGRSHYWALGGVIGLAVDAALVTVAVKNLEEHSLVAIGAY